MGVTTVYMPCRLQGSIGRFYALHAFTVEAEDDKGIIDTLYASEAMKEAREKWDFEGSFTTSALGLWVLVGREEVTR